MFCSRELSSAQAGNYYKDEMVDAHYINIAAKCSVVIVVWVLLSLPTVFYVYNPPSPNKVCEGNTYSTEACTCLQCILRITLYRIGNTWSCPLPLTNPITPHSKKYMILYILTPLIHLTFSPRISMARLNQTPM